jgi:chemotaxis protein methyltransferase CheR
MKGEECVRFLQWAAPQMGLRWEGFRRVRRQVCRRLERRCRALGLADLEAYRRFIEQDPREWAAVDQACRVTISRFGRDRGVWEALFGEVLPRLGAAAAAEGRAVQAWSAGCGAGEEPYTLAIGWATAIAPPPIEIVATDVHAGQLERARAGCYPQGTLRELPDAWRRAGFEMRDGLACVRDEVRTAVRFAVHDLRRDPAPGRFDLVLCRNLAFTYFGAALQRATAAMLRGALRDGGVLVVGAHEQLPPDVTGFAACGRSLHLAVQ